MCSRAEEAFLGRAGSAVHDLTSPLEISKPTSIFCRPAQATVLNPAVSIQSIGELIRSVANSRWIREPSAASPFEAQLERQRLEMLQRQNMTSQEPPERH
jgi:hypothetical protein